VQRAEASEKRVDPVTALTRALVFALGLLGADGGALAQEANQSAEQDADAPETPGGGAEVPVSTVPAPALPNLPDTEQKNGFVRPASQAGLSWAGGGQIDVGYAQYTFESAALNTEEVHDFRGRFVFGPTIVHDLSDDLFLAARGEAVTWVREQFGVYQINVDDVFAQLGQRDSWDLKLGRFRAWRV
jgi:hypothetical protein